MLTKASFEGMYHGSVKQSHLSNTRLRRFEYTTPRIRITPRDLPPLGIEKPETLHFICSPKRAAVIIAEVQEVKGWVPLMIYEPIPVSNGIAEGLLLSTDSLQHRIAAYLRSYLL
jgi:hypothetical protein